MNESVGALLAKLRKDNHLTQEALAQELLVSRETVSKWERGVCFPSPEMLLKLSNKYQISINDMLTYE